MHIIDPLKLKLEELLTKGGANVLNTARLRYGTEGDLRRLEAECDMIQNSKGTPLLVDFTPFERVGRPIEFLEMLAKKSQRQHLAMLVIGDGLLSQLKAAKSKLPIPVVQFNEDGTFARIHSSRHIHSRVRMVIARILYQKQSNSLSHWEVRREFANRLLTKLLFQEMCIVHPKNNKFVVRKNGRSFMRMPNGMLVSCYLNLKELGKKPASLIAVAYEALLALSLNFRRDRNLLDEFDVLVVPNNTALFLVATLQRILETKPLVAINRLGPIPARFLQTPPLIPQLERKRIVLFEEVVATGNEVDRSLLFLRSLQADVKQIIAFYNLDVGAPMLVAKGQLVSLCRPKKELKYVYRSA